MYVRVREKKELVYVGPLLPRALLIRPYVAVFGLVFLGL
jgi:hypothetical protein